jgi:WD40 repeat protein
MTRSGLGLLCWCCVVSLAAAEPPPGPTPAAYPLPRHALARFGPLVLRHGDEAHPASPTALVWLADGRTMITTASDNALHISDATPGHQRHLLHNQGFEPRCLTVTADGKMVAACGDDKAIHLTDPTTGEEVRRLPFPDDQLTALAFSPNGKGLASASLDRNLRLWDPVTGKEVWSVRDKDYWLLSLGFAPGGDILAAGDNNGRLHLRDAATGKPRRSWRAHDQGVERARFSADGKLLATAARDGDVRVWDADKGKLLLTLSELRTHFTNLDDLVFSPDGRLLFACAPSKAGLWVWKMPSGEKAYDVLNPSSPPRRLAFSPDGKTMATVSGNLMHFWDVTTGKALTAEEGHTWGVAGVACSPDGKRVVTAGGDGTVRVWDAATARELHRYRHNREGSACVAISPDGRTLAAGSHNLVVRWELATGKALPPLPAGEGWIQCLAFSPDGKLLAGGGIDPLVRFWDPRTGEESKRSLTVPDHVRGLPFSPDGGTLAVVAGVGDSVLLADVNGLLPERWLKGPKRDLFCVAFSPDGRTVAAGNNEGIVCVWETCTGQELYHFQAHQNLVHEVALSPDGLILASGGQEDEGLVHLWDAVTGKRLAEFAGHRHWVQSIAFTPTGTPWFPAASTARSSSGIPASAWRRVGRPTRRRQWRRSNA